MATPVSDGMNTYSDAETVARRPAALKRAFSMLRGPCKPIGKAGKESQKIGDSYRFQMGQRPRR